METRFLIIGLILLAASASAMRNPAAVYCTQLGYDYETAAAPLGEEGVCVVDGHRYNAWAFFEGKVGREYNYCAKKGYGTIVKKGGPYSKESRALSPACNSSTTS